MPLPREILAASLITLIVAVPDALAQSGRRRGHAPAPAAQAPQPPPHHPSADLIGLEFREQLVSDAIPLVEAGNGDAAAGINAVLADSTVRDEERRRELKAGLALIYARAGDYGNANKNAHDLSEREDGTSLGPRCRAIWLAVAEASKKGQEFKAKMKERETWFDLLRSVRRACEAKFNKAHADAASAVSSQHWTRVVAPVRDAYEEASVIEVIFVQDQGATENFLLEHTNRVASEATALDGAAAEHHRAGVGLAREIGRMGRNPGRFSLIDQYDRHRNEIISAREAHKALVAEFQREQGKNPALRGQVPAFATPDLVRIDKN
jgi:hypothetical protein